MSVPVALAELAKRIDEYGAMAHLISVSGDGEPHVVSVKVDWDGDRLTAGAGNRTAGNVDGNPTVSLLWAAPVGNDYSLIVDGNANVSADRTVLSITPTAAVLHRVAAAANDGPSCIKVIAD